MLQPTCSPSQHGPDLGGHDQGKELRGPGSWAEIGEAAAATGDEGEGGLHLRLRLSGAAVPTQAVPQSLRLWPAQAESPRATLAPARLPSGAKGLCRETGKHGLKGNGTSSALTLEYSSAVKKENKILSRAVMQMDLENSTLSEISRRERQTLLNRTKLCSEMNRLADTENKPVVTSGEREGARGRFRIWD